MQRQALGKIARADADRVERLHRFERRPGEFRRDAELLREFVQVDAQVAVVVDVTDQAFAHRAQDRIGAGLADLGDKVIGKGLRGGEEILQVVAFRRRRSRRRRGR